MILINFSHPLTSQQIVQVEALSGQQVTQMIDLPVQFDNGHDFQAQVHHLLGRMPLSAEVLQTEPILVNPPALNTITALLLAELHGRMGYFPPILRLRPVQGSLPPRYEVAEILNLQAIRDESRKHRSVDKDD
jgi:hypothetical protein